MNIKEQWSIGTLIRNMREKQNITQANLCRGLCSPSTMNRFESGERDMGMLMAFRIFQRLGYTLDSFELYVSNIELEQYEQRILIEQYRDAGDLSRMRQSLHDYQLKWMDDDPLQQQFIKGMESYIHVQEGNIDMGITELEYALELTVPEHTKSLQKSVLVGEDELKLFNMLACANETAGESVKAFKIRERIIDYLELNEIKKDQMIKLYVEVASELAPGLFEMGRIDECLTLCESGIETLSQRKRIFYWAELLYWKAKCLENMYHGQKAERECVIEAFQKAYYISDLLENKVLTSFIWHHLMEEYHLECIV